KMKAGSAISCQFEIPVRFRIYFTEGVFDSSNKLMREVLRSGGERRERLLAVVDQGVMVASPKLSQQLTAYMREASVNLVSDPVVLAGGEALKNEPAAVTDL